MDPQYWTRKQNKEQEIRDRTEQNYRTKRYAHHKVHNVPIDRPAEDHPALIAVKHSAVIARPFGANPHWTLRSRDTAEPA